MAGQGISLFATIRQSEPGRRRTAGNFGKWLEENRGVFREYFRCDLFAGSLNVDVAEPKTLQHDLDEGKYQPAFKICKIRLVGMPPHIGDGQAWRALLITEDAQHRTPCWVFRRIDSKVPAGVLEILAQTKLSAEFELKHGDPIKLTIFEGP